METIAPSHLEHDVGLEEIIARVEHANVAFTRANIDELRMVRGAWYKKFSIITYVA